jgi:lysophospholipase L1-like esterase
LRFRHAERTLCHMIKRTHKRAWELLLGLAILTLMVCGVPLFRSAVLAQGWEADIRAFEKQDQANPPKAGSIVFTGSSSLVRWNTLSEDMKPLPVLNRAFGGSEYTDVNQYVARTVIAYHPPGVVVYAGDNDLAAPAPNTPQSVAKQVQLFVETVHAQLPGTWIYVLSIKPSYLRWDAWPRMKEANQLIKDYVRTQQRVEYVDVATPMFGGQEKPPRDLFVVDGLHPTAKCYALWTSILKPVLMRRFGSKASSQLGFDEDRAGGAALPALIAP